MNVAVATESLYNKLRNEDFLSKVNHKDIVYNTVFKKTELSVVIPRWIRID